MTKLTERQQDTLPTLSQRQRNVLLLNRVRNRSNDFREINQLRVDIAHHECILKITDELIAQTREILGVNYR